MTAIPTGMPVRKRLLVVLMTAAFGGGHEIATASAMEPVRAATTSAHHRLVASARWTHPSEGYRLHVTPTHAGRNRAAKAPAKTLTQAIRHAGDLPFTMTSSIHDSLLNQLKCHAVFAQSKSHWNLEAWRPDVGYARTVAAFCNP